MLLVVKLIKIFTESCVQSVYYLLRESIASEMMRRCSNSLSKYVISFDVNWDPLSDTINSVKAKKFSGIFYDFCWYCVFQLINFQQSGKRINHKKTILTTQLSKVNSTSRFTNIVPYVLVIHFYTFRVFC